MNNAIFESQWSRLKKTIGTILLASIFFVICGFLNASMDITKHDFNGSIYSKINDDKESAVYIYFQSHWVNKWDYSLTEVTDYPVAIHNGKQAWIKLDEDCNRIPKWFLNIKVLPLNHPLFFDSWHLFKSLFFAGIIIMLMIFYFKKYRIIFYWKDWSHWTVALIVFVWLAIVWNLSFNLFYNNILRL